MQTRLCTLRPLRKPLKWEIKLPQKRTMTMESSRRIETVTHLQTRQTRSPKLQIKEWHDLLPASSLTTPTWSHHDRTSSWQRNRLEYSSSMTRCMETSPKGIRVNIANTTRTSVTLLKSALHSRMRLRNSSTAGTSRTPLIKGGPGHRIMHLRQKHHKKSR